MASREARNQGASLCHLLRRWCNERTVRFFSSTYRAFAHFALRLIGFEELGGEDGFETGTLEWQLLNMGKLFVSSSKLILIYSV